MGKLYQFYHSPYHLSSSPLLMIMSAFVLKLREIVDANDPSLSWGATGDSFVVADQATFSTSTLPEHFHSNSFTAFLRQLHLHGFRRIVDDGNAWEFAHASFVEEMPELMSEITLRGTASNSAASNEPAAAVSARVQFLEARLASIEAQMESRLL